MWICERPPVFASVGSHGQTFFQQVLSSSMVSRHENFETQLDTQLQEKAWKGVCTMMRRRAAKRASSIICLPCFHEGITFLLLTPKGPLGPLGMQELRGKGAGIMPERRARLSNMLTNGASREEPTKFPFVHHR